MLLPEPALSFVSLLGNEHQDLFFRLWAGMNPEGIFFFHFFFSGPDSFVKGCPRMPSLTAAFFPDLFFCFFVSVVSFLLCDRMGPRLLAPETRCKLSPTFFGFMDSGRLYCFR